MPLNLFYTKVQKSQKWPKIKSRGPALRTFIFLRKITSDSMQKASLDKNAWDKNVTWH